MKKILYVIIGLVVLYLVFCIAGPSETNFSRETDINASPEAVKTKLTDMEFFQKEWSPWTEKDPNMKVTFTGKAGEEGTSMAWDSKVKEVGKGSMTYNYTKGDSVVHTLHFDDYGDSKVYQVVTPSKNGSHVKWGMYSKNSFMMRGMLLFMNMDKMMGPDFEKGLKKLKFAMENKASKYDIKELSWEAKTYYGTREKLVFDKMTAFFGEAYGKIGTAFGEQKIQPVGAPKAIFFSFDEKTMIADFAAVMEVKPGKKLDGFTKFETPAGKVLHIAYYGPYEGSMEAHMAMDVYMKQNNLTTVSVLEEYVTDPMMEKDPSKWLTNVYYIVK